MTLANTPATPAADAGQDNEIDLKQLLGTLIAARWWLVGFTAAGMLIGSLLAFFSTSIYQADALIQIEDTKGGLLSSLSGAFEPKSSADTEIELIRSRMVLGKTVTDLGLDISAYPIRASVLDRLFPGEPAVLQVGRLEVPESWLGAGLSLEALGGERYRLTAPDGMVVGEGKAGEVLNGKLGVQLFVRQLKAKPGQMFMVVRNSRTAAVAGLTANLMLWERGKQSGIISLSYLSPDPVMAQKVLNQIANNYVRQNVERKSAESQQTLQFLDEQLPEIKKQLEESEVRFNDYRARTGILDVTADGARLLDQSVRAETGLFELQQKRKELLARFTPEHPAIQTLDRQIGAVKANQGKFNSEVSRLPKDQQELLRLGRDFQVNQGLYTQLLNSSQQLKVAKAGTVGNVRIIDTAELPLWPVKPNKLVMVMMTTLLGLVAGVVFAFIRQALQTGIKDASLVEQQLGLTVLATVPRSRQQEMLINEKRKNGGAISVLAVRAPEDLAVESLRSLRTGLHFALLDAANNRLMITGPSPYLGKSFVTINLAAIIASTGKRVVVLDADMRRGYLNEYFGSVRDGGLSELIAGTIPLEQGIRATGVAGFDYIATGVLPPNPAELLLNPRFEALLEQLSGLYDQVLIDSPPVLAVTDAAIIGRQVGATLLLARFAMTPLRELELSCKRLQQAGVPLNGVVLNGVEASNGYAYGYGYKYAYAYGYSKRKDDGVS